MLKLISKYGMPWMDLRPEADWQAACVNFHSLRLRIAHGMSAQGNWPKATQKQPSAW